MILDSDITVCPATMSMVMVEYHSADAACRDDERSGAGVFVVNFIVK